MRQKNLANEALVDGKKMRRKKEKCEGHQLIIKRQSINAHHWLSSKGREGVGRQSKERKEIGRCKVKQAKN